MKSLSEYLQQYENTPTVRPPRHWKADIVNQMIEMGFEKKDYVRWLTMIKRSRKSWGDMMVILKEANGLPSQYSKIGFIINKLKVVKTQKLF